MKIHLLKNIKNQFYNLNRWSECECPILLVIGLSGAGKTTFAQKFAEKTNVVYISFDVLKFYDKASKESQEILDIFVNMHPAIINLVKTQWKSSNKLYIYYCNIFFDFLINYCKHKNKKIILEGIQIFVRLTPDKTLGMPLIIIGSSSLKSAINKYKRDYMKNEYYSAAEPPVRCGKSHLSGLTEPLRSFD